MNIELIEPDATPLNILEPGHDRSKFLGGSDIAAVMGLSPWATPLELWMEKTGRTPRQEPTPEKARVFARGKKLEPYVLEMVIDKLVEQGHEVELVCVNHRYQDAELLFLASEIDFELLLDGEHINGDCKTVHGFARKKWGEEDTEDVPIEYAAQFMHGLGVTGRSKCLVAALIGLDDVAIYWVYRDDETIKAMREKATMFWNDCVLADVPPDTWTFSDIKLLFPTDNGDAIEATEEVAAKVGELRRIKASIKQLEDVEEGLTFEIGKYISPNSILKFAGREIATWKAQDARRLDQARLKEEAADLYDKFSTTTTSRVMRLKKGI